MNIKQPSTIFLAALLTVTLLTGCQVVRPDDAFTSTEQSDTTPDAGLPREADGRSAELLSAFFGLDDGLPVRTNAGICRGSGRADGMPVILSHEVDIATMQAGDFQVVTESGRVGELACVTLFPAIDPGELRTVLLTGDYGEAESDPPVTVEIVGNLHSIDGSVNFKNSSIDVTQLAPGPTLILAEQLPESAWRLGRESSGRGGSSSGCPTEGVEQVVRVTWAGGVTTESDEEPGDFERELYSVMVQAADGTTRDVLPFALGDLGDGDNNHELCLDTADPALSVSFPAGYLVDPNGDLNPDTSIEVIR